MSDSELVTALVWNTLTVQSKTLKGIWQWLRLYHRADFPRIPTYRAFVTHCHRALPDLLQTLGRLLATDADIRIMDATMVEVCKLVRADSHKVAKTIAKFGKNHQGWHYGFKLHASIDLAGRFAGLVLTPANIHDAQAMYRLVDKRTRLAVGDTLYGANVMRGLIFEAFGTIVIAPPHPKQKRKLMARWQHRLLLIRPKIESVFDYLKEHLHLVTSFPRSVRGYVLHYARILLSYQIMAL